MTDHTLVGQRTPESDAIVGPCAHILDSTLSDADGTHAMMDAARTKARLGNGEPFALAGDYVCGWDTYVAKAQLGVPSVFMIVVAEDVHAAVHNDARSVSRH